MKSICTRLTKAFKRHPLAILTPLVIIMGWQIASYFVPTVGYNAAPRLPGWDYVFTTGFLGISDYWSGGWGAPSTVRCVSMPKTS